MAALSVEDENYVRMCLLLTGISPRAVRKFFDNEFDPVCLDASLKKEYNKLLDLQKNHRINKSQWNLLFPRFPDVPDSKNFDVTLMTMLLRNLTTLNPPCFGFDCLPSAMETTPAADLARIKYYRNYLAHLDDGKLDITFFNTAWNDITAAIERLGGQQMKQECYHMKTKPLDQTNQEIMRDIKHSNDEIRELKESFENLKLSHNQLLENHAVVTKEMEEIKITQRDTVPWNIRERITNTLEAWKDNDDKMFINTRAAQYVLKCIKENSCVTITASSGVGKTATLRHTALQLAEEEYDVLLVSDPNDILKFHNANKKTLFIIDDLCGHFSLEQGEIKRWDPVIEDITKILDNKKTKLLASCRLQIYQDEQFDSISVFKSCVCNMLSEDICLSKPEKYSLAQLYLKGKASEIGDYYDLYDCFPLLCKLYYDNPKLNVSDFFQNPFTVYEAEIDSLLKRGYHTKYCALALCVVFNNTLKEEMLIEEVNAETKTIIENICEACKLDRGTSRIVLNYEFNLLTPAFIKKEHNVYKTIHDKIFDFLVYYFGQKMIYCLIKNANSGLIKERFLLEKRDDMDKFITIIPPKLHQLYMQRMIDDWSKKKLQGVFTNINMKIPQFRQKFLSFLKALSITYQRQLANAFAKLRPTKTFRNVIKFRNNDVIRDNLEKDHHHDDNGHPHNHHDSNDNGHPNSHHDSDDNGHPYSQHDSDDNGHPNSHHDSDDDGHPYSHYDIDDNGHPNSHHDSDDDGHPYSHYDIDDNGHPNSHHDSDDDGHPYSHYDIDDNGHYDDGVCDTVLLHCCYIGDISLIEWCCNLGVDVNRCSSFGQSPIMIGCEQGHTDVVKMLLDRRADCNTSDLRGKSPLMVACEGGNTGVVKMLLDRGADSTKCMKWTTPEALMSSGLKSLPELLHMLANRGEDFDKCPSYGSSPLLLACEHGHTEIVDMLLARGVNWNKRDNVDESPLMVACKHGKTEIVKMLLDRGLDCNECNRFEQSPVILACQHSDTEIVKILLDRGADYNKFDIWGQSPLMVACKYGKTEVVEMLLDRGVDCNRWDTYDMSPVMKACEHGHTAILKMLLDRGAESNKCDWMNDSPLVVACKHGYTEMVKMLLDRGTDCSKCMRCRQSTSIGVCEHVRTDIVNMLLDIEADCNTGDEADKSIVKQASKRDHKEIVNMLLER